MRARRLGKWIAATSAISASMLLQSAANGQVIPPAGAASGQVVSGPTGPQYGFPNPGAPKPSTVWNPFAQAATAIQGVFRPSPPQYRTAMAPGDPTSLKTNVPAITQEVHLQAARLAFSRGRLAEARGNYEKVLTTDPKNLESLISLARIADSESGFDAARAYYVRALNAFPTRAAVHNDFGMSAARNQRMDIALMAFAEAVRLEPKSVRYRNNAAKAFLQAGQWREALEQLVAAHPPAAAHYNYAFLLDQVGGPNEQIVFHARQALRFDPNFVAAQKLASEVSQRQLALQSQRSAPGRAFLPATSQTPASARQAPATAPQAPAMARQAPYSPPQGYVPPQGSVQPRGSAPPQAGGAANNARFPAPTGGYRQSRRLPNAGAANDSMFPPQQPGRPPVYLPPAAPAWPRR